MSDKQVITHEGSLWVLKSQSGDFASIGGEELFDLVKEWAISRGYKPNQWNSGEEPLGYARITIELFDSEGAAHEPD